MKKLIKKDKKTIKIRLFSTTYIIKKFVKILPIIIIRYILINKYLRLINNGIRLCRNEK